MLRRTNASIPVGVQELRASNGGDEGTSARSKVFDVCAVKKSPLFFLAATNALERACKGRDGPVARVRLVRAPYAVPCR